MDRLLTALPSPNVSDKLLLFWRDYWAAFEELKRRLDSTPILGLQRSKGDYLVDTHASNYQVGRVLTQEHLDKTFQPVGYWSRLIKGAERTTSRRKNTASRSFWISLCYVITSK